MENGENKEMEEALFFGGVSPSQNLREGKSSVSTKRNRGGKKKKKKEMEREFQGILNPV